MHFHLVSSLFIIHHNRPFVIHAADLSAVQAVASFPGREAYNCIPQHPAN